MSVARQVLQQIDQLTIILSKYKNKEHNGLHLQRCMYHRFIALQGIVSKACTQQLVMKNNCLNITIIRVKTQLIHDKSKHTS